MLDFYNYNVMFTTELMNDGYDVYMNKSDVTKDPEEVKGHYFNNKIHWVKDKLNYKNFQEGSGVIALDLWQFYDFIYNWYHSCKVDTDPSFSINTQRWYEYYLSMMNKYYTKNRLNSPKLWTYYDSVTLYSLEERPTWEYCSPNGNRCFINFPKGRILEPEISWAFVDCVMKFRNSRSSLFEGMVKKHIKMNYEKTIYCAMEASDVQSFMKFEELLFHLNKTPSKGYDLLNRVLNNPIDVAKGRIVNTAFIADFIRRLPDD